MAAAHQDVEALLRALPDPVLFLDDRGTIVAATERQVGGWTRAQVVDRTFPQLFPDHLRSELDRTIAAWAHTGTSPFAQHPLRLPLRRPDGGTVRVEARVARTDTGFAVAIHQIDDGGDALRVRLLEAASAPVVDGAVLDSVVAHVGEAFVWNRAVLWIEDPSAPTLRARASWARDVNEAGVPRAATPTGTVVPGEGRVGDAWGGDDPVIVDDGDRIEVFVPIGVGRRPVAVLELCGDHEARPQLWLQSDLAVVAAALGHLCDRFRDRLQADALGGRLSLALDAGRFGVWTLDVRSGAAEWNARMGELHGIDPELRAGGPDTVFEQVAHDDRNALGHALARARTGDEPVAVEYRVTSSHLRGRSERRWISARLARVRNNGGPALLSVVAADITDRKRSELEARRRTAAVEGLQWVSRSIIAGRQLHEIAEGVARSAADVLGADYGVVLYPEPGEVASGLAWAVGGIAAGDEIPGPPSHIELPDAIVDGAPAVNLGDVGAAPATRAFLDHLDLPGIASHHSVLLVPVQGVGDRALGLMVFTSAARDHFTPDDAALAASIGSSTGVAIENAQRHEQQRLAVMAFQRQLLPVGELDSDRLDVCVRYHPGRDGLDVGGDWYDLIDLPDGRFGLAVGDVCGHGVQAAAHMGQFRYSFRALVQSSITPAEALGVLNRMALTELGTTATMAYVEVDPATGSCELWSCGHLPPVISEPGGGVRWVDERDRRGPMLGFLDRIDVRPIRATLAPGDVLLLYTDGLVERRGEDIDVGLARLASAFAVPDDDLDAWCDDVYARLAVVGPDADDTVVLAVRRR